MPRRLLYVRSGRVVLGIILVVIGLILSFVFPIMSIVPNMIVEYPPSQVQGDGATFSEGKYVYQEFRSDINLKFDSSTDALWIGMWRDEGIIIPQGYGIVGRVINKDSEIQQGDFSSACFNIDIDNIPTNDPGYVKVRWIDDADYPHSPGCKYLRPYGHSPDFLEFEIGKTYRIYMYAVNAMVEPQHPDNAISLPSVFWQWTTVDIDGHSGEANGMGISFIDDLSFGISAGTYEEVENGDDGITTDDDDITDDAPVETTWPVFIGPLFLTLGILIFLMEFRTFTKPDSSVSTDTWSVQWSTLFIVIGLLIFTAIFWLVNQATFWWEWLF